MLSDASETAGGGEAVCACVRIEGADRFCASVSRSVPEVYNVWRRNSTDLRDGCFSDGCSQVARTRSAPHTQRHKGS